MSGKTRSVVFAGCVAAILAVGAPLHTHATPSCPGRPDRGGVEEGDRFWLVFSPGAPEDHNGNGYVCHGVRLPDGKIRKFVVVDDIDN